VIMGVWNTCRGYCRGAGITHAAIPWAYGMNDKTQVYCASQKTSLRAECLKDIDRFLRRDFDDERKALLLLGKCNVVSNNLVPLLKTYPTDRNMVQSIRAFPLSCQT
jgi:hypothetical protein